MKPKMERVIVSPEYAAKLLSKNPINRNLRWNRIRNYARDMLADRWRDNGVPIIVDEDGRLRDGQHRLNAIVSSGVSLPMWICTVGRDEAQMYDIGMSRSMGDNLLFTNDERLIALSKSKVGQAAAFLLKKKIGKTLYTMSQCIDMISENIDVFEWVANAKLTKSKKYKGVCRASVIACIASAYKSGYPEYKLNHFIDVLLSGVMEAPCDITIIRFREWALNHLANEESNSPLPGYDTYMRCQYALYQYEQGKACKMSRAAKEEYYRFYED